MEKKFEKYIGKVKYTEEEDIQGKKLQSDLWSRVCNLEDWEGKLVQENEELRAVGKI